MTYRDTGIMVGAVLKSHPEHEACLAAFEDSARLFTDAHTKIGWQLILRLWLRIISLRRLSKTSQTPKSVPVVKKAHKITVGHLVNIRFPAWQAHAKHNARACAFFDSDFGDPKLSADEYKKSRKSAVKENT